MLPNQKSKPTQPNSSPLDVFNIQGNPFSFEGALRRHGQLTRILQAKLCPCNDRGTPDMLCNLCSGKGFIFSYQTSLMVIDENSPHDEQMNVYPLGTPVTKVLKVDKPLPDYQGGIVNYETVSIADDKNSFSVCGKHWKEWEKIRCSYEYTLLRDITNEIAIVPEQGYAIIVSAPVSVVTTSNPFGITGDVYSVASVINETNGKTYTVLKVQKNTIHLVNNTFPIAVTDVVKVTYKYLYPFNVVTGRIEENNNFSVPFESVKEGDLQAVFSNGVNLSKSDIITFLVGKRKDTSIIKKSANAKEEIPQFDVTEILDVIDEDGVKYILNTDYYLFNYNEIKWVSNHKPATNKKYSISFLYRPSYKIFRQNADYMNNENKYFVQYAMLRYMNKFDKKDIEVI